MTIRFGRDVCGDLTAASEREWLVTNGIGGYASGTISGVLTRRYHGLLIAALKPPVARTLLVAKLDERVRYRGVDHPLHTNVWGSGAVNPAGWLAIESFSLHEGAFPTWRYAFSDALLEKTLWMEQGANTTYIRYRVVRAALPVVLFARALVNSRDSHDNTVGVGEYAVESVRRGLRIVPPGGEPYYLLSDRADASPMFDWYRDFALAIETERGLPDRDDHVYAGDLAIALSEGETVTFVATTQYTDRIAGDEAYARALAHQQSILERLPDGASAIVHDLARAADQFIVARPLADVPDGKTVIAGYPWFTDWGRDTMIALPGLTLPTGRHADAAIILRTFARFVDQGMLPNTFPDDGETPMYNTVDAALWYFEAIRAYHEAIGDTVLLCELYPTLKSIIDWHVRGTRFGIGVDPADGLLRAGEAGVQLTWMDVKIDEWVVTPRTGKPVEINALWINALHCMADFAVIAGVVNDSAGYLRMAERARASFQRFWNSEAGYLYDVIDTPDGTHDASIRPNAVFAVGLHHCADLLTEEQARMVVDECAASLLTSHGLRSLHPQHPDYQGVYVGDRETRDARYHQGTVWGWLIGVFAEAYYNVYGDRGRAAG